MWSSHWNYKQNTRRRLLEASIHTSSLYAAFNQESWVYLYAVETCTNNSSWKREIQKKNEIFEDVLILHTLMPWN